MELVAQGRVTPMVDWVFALADVESAFESLRRGEPLGRNVLAVYGISESVAKPACPELVRGLTGFTYCQQALLCTRS